MVHKCVVPGCPNQSDKKTDVHGKRVQFHRLPHKNKKLLQTWLDLIGRTLTEVTVNSRICSVHFSEGGLKKFGYKVPEIFPWQSSHSLPPQCSTSLTPVSPTTSQILSPPQCSSPTTSLTSLTSVSPTTSQSLPPQSATHSPQSLHSTSTLATSESHIIPCATCVVYHDHSYSNHHHTHTLALSQHMLSCNIGSAVTLTPSIPLTIRNTGTQTNMSLYFCIENIMDDDSAINFYTGFESYTLLRTCFQFLGEAVYHLKYWGKKSHTSSVENRGSSRSLTPINEFFLVLCRLRCGLMECDLAYRFKISQPTVSRIIITWTNFLYCKFKDIKIWPSREQVLHFMPNVFKEFYPTTRCIIDATELFIQSPSDPKAQQLTFSSYKNHNTFKAIVCITPSGAISFVSKLYGGSISDRQLTEKCGILDLLEPGDSIMADKGFTIADLTEQRGVTLNIPPFKHDNQFTERELLTTRRIASLRIHVERAIGRIKNFKILNDIPNNM